MSASQEAQFLRHADELLDEAAARLLPRYRPAQSRAALLEVLAAGHGGWEIDEYWQTAARLEAPSFDEDPWPWARKLASVVEDGPVPLPLALSALAREALPAGRRRTSGAYYTDWRLAQMLAEQATEGTLPPGLWVDPACGTGVLLVAAAMTIPAGSTRDEVIRDRLTGADLSPLALRGALAAVASLTADLDAVRGFAGRLLCQDSLQSTGTWARLAPAGASLVIGNPPWEKLRPSRHEYVRAMGMERHYGQGYTSEVDLGPWRAQILRYVESVASGTRLQGKGEHDLYRLFLELGIGLVAEEGVLAMLVPAGLIRAQGTEPLRRELERAASDLSIDVIENRARHFAIDTRFKFVTVVARIGGQRREPIRLRVADRTGQLPAASVRIDRRELAKVRPDRSLPEVRDEREWDLFKRLATSGVTVGDPSGPWRPDYRREVDMTTDRHKFVQWPAEGTLALLEGRHVTHYRWRAKAYVSGEGRSAVWRPEPLRDAPARPTVQWYVPVDALTPQTRRRTACDRIGFCDITGQTNERSLLAARIPAGVACGNKVPTLLFPEGGRDREDLFLVLANSFVVDWMLRRVVTTTVNRFVLESLPLPRVHRDPDRASELVALGRAITGAEADRAADLDQVGRWRARADALVAAVWGLDLDDMQVVLADFPLLDRGQPPLSGERASTVTRDSVLAELAELYTTDHPAVRRADQARSCGATAYISAEYV